MSKIVLDQSQVISLISQVKTTGMPEHMRVDRPECGAPGSGADEVVHRLSGHRLLTFGQKEPREGVVACLQITLDGPQLVTGDGVFNGQPIFEPPNPYPSSLEIQVRVPHPDGFADAQAVAIHHEQQQKISDPMTTFLGRLKESVDFGVCVAMERKPGMFL